MRLGQSPGWRFSSTKSRRERREHSTPEDCFGADLRALPMKNRNLGVSDVLYHVEAQIFATFSRPYSRPSSRPSRPSHSPGRRLVVRHESTGLSLGTRDKLRAALLSGVAGFVDAAGLLSLATMFPAHITGELVSDTIALSVGQGGPTVTHFWMVPTFVLAVAVAAVVARVERRAVARRFRVATAAGRGLKLRAERAVSMLARRGPQADAPRGLLRGGSQGFRRPVRVLKGRRRHNVQAGN